MEISRNKPVSGAEFGATHNRPCLDVFFFQLLRVFLIFSSSVSVLEVPWCSPKDWRASVLLWRSTSASGAARNTQPQENPFKLCLGPGLCCCCCWVPHPQNRAACSLCGVGTVGGLFSVIYSAQKRGKKKKRRIISNGKCPWQPGKQETHVK